IVPGRELDLAAVVLVIIGSSALLLRRKAPVVGLAITLAAMIAIYLRDYGTFVAMMGLISVYSVAAHEQNRRLAWTAIVLGCGTLFVVASVTILDQGDGYRVADAVSMVILLISVAAAGGVMRNREEIFADTRARAERAEADRQVEAERAVARERLRIAREMHDVVAHGMSVISVQAAAAREIVHDDPERAAELMGNVETSGREALDELRRMLGVLRSGEDAGRSLRPQPALGDVAGAIDDSIASGVPTELVLTGTRRDLPAGIELTAFRIVQEALTNVRKHAGTQARAEVRIDYGASSLTVDVVDDGAGRATALTTSGAGQGLIGMRERVELYDGTVESGPRTGGGFAVRARIPVGPDDRRAVA
ncbi:MAG: sensor histidine kinase, partial [Actinomycetota bacterium]